MTDTRHGAFAAFFILAAAALAAADSRAQSLLRPRPLPTPRGRNAPAAAAAANAAAPAAATASANAYASAAGGDREEAADINFQDAPVDMVLDVYGKLVNKSVLADPAVPKNATITFKSRPGLKLSLEDQIEAVRILLEMNGVHMEDFSDKFVRALPRKDARHEGIPIFMSVDDPGLAEISQGQVVTVNLPFSNITVDEAQKALEGFKSNSGLLQVFERINSIFVTDTKMNILNMAEVASKLDVARQVDEIVEAIQIKYASADDMRDVLQKIVDDAMKAQENEAKAKQSAQMQSRGSSASPAVPTRTGPLLNRPGAAPNAPAAPVSVESLVTSMSEADRGVIRGRVLIIAEPRTNKLLITTNKANMDFFKKVIAQLDIETTPDTVVKAYRLKYAEAEDVVSIINDLIGSSASSKSGTKQNQNQNSRSGTSGNISRGTTSAAPQPSASARSGEPRSGELTKDNTTIRADKRMNGVVYMTLKELEPTLIEIIERLDVKLSQVLIETCIIEVTLGDGIQTGVDWVMRGRQHGIIGYENVTTTDDDGNTKTSSEPIYGLNRDAFVNNGNFALGGGGGTGSEALNLMMHVATNATSAIFGGATPINSGINYLLKSDKLNIAAVIKATKDDSHAKYIAAPIIMTQDNKEATIDATEKRKFFAGYETSSSYSTYVRTPKYDSDEIGIKIKVKPKINPNGTVMLNVEEEYTQLGAGQSIIVDNGNGGEGTAFIDTALKRKMTSDVLLENMQTVVLGGLSEKYESEKETGIPFLKDIPWIGKWLFGSVEKEEQRKELLVFMTPYVIDDPDLAQRTAERLKNSLSDPRPWDLNGWSASKLADPVSQKETLRRLKGVSEKQDEDRNTRLAVEKWKLERAKQLEKQDRDEREFWIDEERENLSREERRKFDEEVRERIDLSELAAEIRARELAKAQETIDGAEEKAKAQETTAGAEEKAKGQETTAGAEEKAKGQDREKAAEPVQDDVLSLFNALDGEVREREKAGQ